ncbi:MAG: PH domain-containing protein [Verrucomicrobiales bacterium]|nr:PH domain-containing protein [Verrucomicrobiales bacterium]
MSPTNVTGVESMDRPNPRLMTYYFLTALVVPPAFPVLILILYFRYHTMRYRFDGEGVSMRWGILFRREILLNYARIQDIQIRANLVERWLGIARIEIQTAAGSSGAEMTLEGFVNYEEVRDFLYERMRGARGESHRSDRTIIGTSTAPALSGSSNPEAEELAAVLREVAAEIRAMRSELEKAGRHDS